MPALPVTRVPATVIALTAVLALGAGCSSSDDAATSEPSPSAAGSVSPASPASAAPPTDDQVCALFVQFAADQSQHAGNPDATTTEALIRSGLTLANLPATDSMSDGVHASLVELVRQTLDGVVAPADLPVVEGTPDEPAFSAYLNQYCPA